MATARFPWLLIAISVAFISISLVNSSPSLKIKTVVDLAYARYEGDALPEGLTRWRGMRFAAAPLGDLRFRAPRDPPHVEGIQKADQWKPGCIGASNDSGLVAAEDCLLLDVLAPSDATPRSKLPVWFFIQGGGYAANSNDNFDAAEVILQSGKNMVFVQINYRVGPFGFLASDKVQRDGDLNVGLLDQEKALEWVQNYIHLFGGDPDHVVIHGVSAGAGSVAYHLTAHGGNGKSRFVGAIAESPFWPTHRTVADSEFQFAELVSALDCTDSHDTMQCLRQRDKGTFVSASSDLHFPGAPKNFPPAFYWLPVIDGSVSTDLLYKLFEQGKVKKVPLLVGGATDEGSIFTPAAVDSQDIFLDFISANFPKLTSEDMQRIQKSYPSPDKSKFLDKSAWFDPAQAAYGESTFTCPGVHMSQAYVQYSPETWNFRYDVEGEYSPYVSVYHTVELSAVFGPDYVPGNCEHCSYKTYNKKIVPVVMSYWISFIRSLNPNTHKLPGSPVWKPWRSCAGGNRLRFERTIPGWRRFQWISLSAVTCGSPCQSVQSNRFSVVSHKDPPQP